MVSFFLSHELYGTRPFTHFDCFHAEPGHLYIELGSWTLEVDHPFYRRAPAQPPQPQEQHPA